MPIEAVVPLVIGASTQVQLNSRLASCQELVSTGRLVLIEDREIRTALADDARVTDEFEPFWAQPALVTEGEETLESGDERSHCIPTDRGSPCGVTGR